MASAQAPVRAPSAPVSAPLSPEALAKFQELKRTLGEMVSWELTSDGYEALGMSFTEGGNEQQARTFAAILK